VPDNLRLYRYTKTRKRDHRLASALRQLWAGESRQCGACSHRKRATGSLLMHADLGILVATGPDSHAKHHRVIDLYETNHADLFELLNALPVYQGYGLDFP